MQVTGHKCNREGDIVENYHFTKEAGGFSGRRVNPESWRMVTGIILESQTRKKSIMIPVFRVEEILGLTSYRGGGERSRRRGGAFPVN